MKSKAKPTEDPTKEHERLRQLSGDVPVWRRWGPYVSERAWGTVREDYSPDGNAWDFLTHDMSRSKAYRWGEDGLAGICDRYQLLVFALALWNERDAVLKERAFGVTPAEANHGEDVKEYYFYLDSTPTHSYMKYLYKYPHAEFPYRQLIEENRKRGGHGFEYELLDTGLFNEDRYFDVFVEYAKSGPEDICIRIEAFNRGPDAAPIQIIPHLWFRNTWAWTNPRGPEPSISLGPSGNGHTSLIADDSNAEMLHNLPFEYRLGPRFLYADHGAEPLFTFNETNLERFYGVPNSKPYVKDAFHRRIVHGEECVNPERRGTKSCLRYRSVVPAGGSAVFRLRLTPDEIEWPLADLDNIVSERRREADEFYDAIQPPKATEDERRVQRQAFAGLLWTKQIYLFDVNQWFEGDDPANPPPRSRTSIRNVHWRHLNSMRILSMPDKWEYPWFASWDLAFHTVALALVDAEFAKEQLWLLLFEQFQHPNGQIPAYEWEFSDLNPPVIGWAVWRVYNMDRVRSGKADREWLERCYHKLLINFAWWVNRVDREGNNIFEGGFLGLDNITVIDRSEKLPGGAVLEQSDATGWMGMFCLNLMRIGLELAKENRAYEALATKFFQHYVYVGAAMKRMGGRDYSLWDERDGFFYDVLRYPDGSFHKFRVRSLVGLIPLYAIERLEVDWIKPFAGFRSNLQWFIRNRQDIVQRCCHAIEHDGSQVYVLAIVDEEQMKRIIERIFDPSEFLSDYGIRSLSKYHEQNPFSFGASEVRYEPAESDSKLKGGNSNWRGPIWFPTSFLLIESLRKLGTAYGPNFKLSVPGIERPVSLSELAEDIANRLIRIFLRNEEGRRPVYGGAERFQNDPLWRDHLLFFEFFHGDNGAGIGASHQTGWTALVASLIDEWRR
jgi:Mannosylglycerate hydrolase MGH1-like glycoside hydrolase domain/Glycosyl hydrolase family 63 C-terminal domain